MIKIKNKIKSAGMILIPILIFACVYFLCFYSKLISNGIRNGLELCVTTLIPSLYIFMILSDIVANNKTMRKLAQKLHKPFYMLTGLQGECIIALVMSLVGGYPVGAKCTEALYKNKSITKSQAQKLSLVAFSSGFGFVINYVALSLFNRKCTGYILMLSQVIAFVINLILCCVFIKTEDESIEINSKLEKYSFVDAVSNGTKATVNMCAMVILFSGILTVSEKVLNNQPFVYDIICAISEVTNATNTLYKSYPLYVTSFIIGFGGLCVHFQVFSILKDIEVNKCLFFTFRIIGGISSSIASYILLKLSNDTADVFSTISKATFGNSTTIWGSLALMITGVCFLNSLKLSKHIRR